MYQSKAIAVAPSREEANSRANNYFRGILVMLPEIRYSTAPSSSRLSIQIRTGMEDPCSSWTASHVLLTRKGQAQVKGPSRDTAVVSVSQTFQFIHEISFRGGNSTLRIPLQFTLELECQYAPYLTWKYPHCDNLIFKQ